MEKIEHIFFDLDHTLWDFDRSAKETVEELYRTHGIAEHRVSEEEFLAAFYEVNDYLWSLYNRTQIDRQGIRDTRFPRIFKKLGISARLCPPNIGAEYISICPQKPYVMEHTHTLLNYLSGKYRLHVLTNGFKDIQHQKMQSAGILPYFEVVVTSECTGYRKPDPQVYEHALLRASASTQNVLMVGDNLSTDVKGSIQAGWRAVYYNPGRRTHAEPVYADIASLAELCEIL